MKLRTNMNSDAQTYIRVWIILFKRTLQHTLDGKCFYFWPCEPGHLSRVNFAVKCRLGLFAGWMVLVCFPHTGHISTANRTSKPAVFSNTQRSAANTEQHCILYAFLQKYDLDLVRLQLDSKWSWIQSKVMFPGDHGNVAMTVEPCESQSHD